MRLATVLSELGIQPSIHNLLQHVPTDFSTYSSQSRNTLNGRRSSNMGLGGHLADPTNILAARQRLAVNSAAVAASTVSIVACLTVTYWFCMMKRNFRRQ